MIKTKKRNQTTIGVPLRVKVMLNRIKQVERRPQSQQLEILAEQECKRLGIEIPAEKLAE